MYIRFFFNRFYESNNGDFMIWFLFFALTVIQLADIFSSMRVLSTEKGKEANSTLKKLIDRIGVFPTLLIIKITFLSLIVLIILEGVTIADYILWVMIVHYIYKIYYSFEVYKKIMKVD